jgi:hypothetical protein
VTVVGTQRPVDTLISFPNAPNTAAMPAPKAAIVVLFGGFALLTSMYGVQPPELVAYFKDKTFLVIAAFGAGIAAVFGAFGKLISVSTGR